MFLHFSSDEAQEPHPEISRKSSNIQYVILNYDGAGVAVGRSELRDAWNILLELGYTELSGATNDWLSRRSVLGSSALSRPIAWIKR